jgi:hypothetical protein
MPVITATIQAITLGEGAAACLEVGPTASDVELLMIALTGTPAQRQYRAVLLDTAVRAMLARQPVTFSHQPLTGAIDWLEVEVT